MRSQAPTSSSRPVFFEFLIAAFGRLFHILAPQISHIHARLVVGCLAVVECARGTALPPASASLIVAFARRVVRAGKPLALRPGAIPGKARWRAAAWPAQWRQTVLSGCSIRPGWVHFEVCGVVFGGVSGRDASKSLKLRHGFRSRDPTNRQIISRTLPEGFPAPSISASPASRQYPGTQATAMKRPRGRTGRGAS